MPSRVRRLSRPVLIVDDDVAMRRFVVDVLTHSGLKVVTAENGLEALEQLRRHRPCLVLLDLAMPLMDGSEFVKTVRGDPEFPAVPIICVSGLPDARDQAQRLGLAECLSKPIHPDVLVTSVLRQCARS
jgi:CheY-like chemotaxis protein